MAIKDYDRGRYKKGEEGFKKPRLENDEVEAFLESYGVKTNHHYVDNKKFYEDIVAFRKSCLEAQEAGKPRPDIPEEIVNNIILISTHLAYRPNFSGYSFRDDMVHAGIENCVRYIMNFDPEKSQNPFAYFTSVCWYAFVRLIKESKKQSIIKGWLVMNNTYDESLEIDSDVDNRSVYQDLAEQMSTYIEAADQFNKKKALKEAERKAQTKEKKIESVLDSFFDFGDEQKDEVETEEDEDFVDEAKEGAE